LTGFGASGAARRGKENSLSGGWLLSDSNTRSLQRFDDALRQTGNLLQVIDALERAISISVFDDLSGFHLIDAWNAG
jgi:hypothetical protein